MQKGQTALFLLIGLVIIVAVGTGVFYLGKSKTPKSESQNPVVTSQTSQSSLASPTKTQENMSYTPVLVEDGDLVVYDVANGYDSKGWVKGNKITNWGHNSKPLVSPDGTKMAYTSQTKESVDEKRKKERNKEIGYYLDSENIWIINTDGTNAYPLTTYEKWINREVIKWVGNYQVVVREGESTVKVYDTNTKQVRLLIGSDKPSPFCLDACGYGFDFYTSLDKRYLVRIYSGGSGGEPDIAIIDLDNLEVKAVDNPYNIIDGVNFDESQDKLLFITWNMEQNPAKHHATLDLRTGKLSF